MNTLHSALAAPAERTTMSDRSVIHSTFVIERTYPTNPERLFAAFSDREKKMRWFAQGHSHTVEGFEMDFRVGGFERTRYRFNENSLFPGVPLTSDGIYQDIVPNERVVMAASMAMGGKNISAALATFEFVPVEDGTRLVLTHQAAFFEGADGPQMREQGWRKLLESLAKEWAR